MSRRPSEMHTSDWVDVFCSVCHRRVYEGEWRDEEESGTVCLDCHNRLTLMEDAPEANWLRYQRSRFAPRG